MSNIRNAYFTKQSFIKLRGYECYPSNHPENAAKGGSAVIIKTNISHYEQYKIETSDIQSAVVCVETKNYKIHLASLYCLPKHKIKKERYEEFLKCMGKRFIIGGDFNAKHTHWGSRLTTTKGRQLLEAVQSYKCETLSTGKPTYYPTDPNKVPDLIDFYIIKNISSNYMHIEDNLELTSDRIPVILTLSEHIMTKPAAPTLINRKTNWEGFKRTLEERIELNVSLQTEDQLDFEVEKLISDIQQAAWQNTPIVTRKLKGNNYPREILKLIAEKRKARKKWQRTRAPQDKTVANNLAAQLKYEIAQLKNESMSNFLENLTNDSSTEYSLWKTTKNLKRPIMHTPPIKNIDGTWARNNEEKALKFADYLEQIFQPNTTDNNETLENMLEQENVSIQNVTLNEVKHEIKVNIESKKAPGFDLITDEILKELPDKAILKLTNLINASFRLQYVPQLWKVAEVIMIQKPGKPPHEIRSYRPISLLPVISKLFEKLLLKRLKPIIEEKKLIPDHQFGFRNQHSTIDQVHRITNVIESALEENGVCSAIFLDVKQAFDKVWHEGLKHKLKLLLPAQYSKILDSYISERYFRIKQEGTYSELKKIQAGVPQGSVLGPVLYLLYTSDLPTFDQNIVATFADDTAIMATGKDNIETTEKLQEAINEVQKWADKWRIKLNEAKSVHIDFTYKRIEYKPVYMNDLIIQFANTAKYLGMTLDTKLKWKPHVKKKLEELNFK
jgi:hypothetical protein